MPGTAHSDVRRRPAQARSRERFDRILGAAADLIGLQGVSAVTMTHIADQAGMALTAVYRYFPNKHSVLKELALQTFARDRDALFSGDIDPDASTDELLAAGIQEFWRRHRAEPFRLQLRAAIHADAELSALDLAESRHNAAVLADLMLRSGSRESRVDLERRALLVVELIDSLMSLASRVPPAEATALVDEFVVLAVRSLVQPPRH